MSQGFDVKDALLAVLRAASVAPASPLFGLDVHDSWPTKGLQEAESVLVLGIDGDEVPATMRGGGGTRDDTFVVEVRVAVVKKSSDPKVPRDRAKALEMELKRLVRESGHPCFGVQGVRNGRVRTYRIAEFLVDRGRECDVHLSFAFTGRLRLGG